MTVLEETRTSIEGPYGAVARADAVRQVTLMKEFTRKDAEVREKINELTVKDGNIQGLQQELVCL